MSVRLFARPQISADSLESQSTDTLIEEKSVSTQPQDCLLTVEAPRAILAPPPFLLLPGRIGRSKWLILGKQMRGASTDRALNAYNSLTLFLHTFVIRDHAVFCKKWVGFPRILKITEMVKERKNKNRLMTKHENRKTLKRIKMK